MMLLFLPKKGFTMYYQHIFKEITTELKLARLEEEKMVPRMGRMVRGAANIKALLAKR